MIRQIALATSLVIFAPHGAAAQPAKQQAEPNTSTIAARIDGGGPDWRSLGEQDFVNVNCDPGTWTWKGGHAFCTGKPVGVIRSKRKIKNFELVCEWMHKQKGGNSGVFVSAISN